MIDRPKAAQSTLYLGLPVADPSNPDYMPLRVMNALRADFGASEEQCRTWTQRWIAGGFAALEEGAPEDGLFGGERPDLADVCLVPQLYNARRFDLDLEAFPRLVRIDAALRAIDPIARAAPEAVRPAQP